MSIFLVYFSLKLTQTHYKNVASKYDPLFIPKFFGVGITINPFNFFGKLIWIGLIIFLITILISMIFTPS